MTRYIWITSIVIVFILILAFKQAGEEPPVERPSEAVQNATTTDENLNF